MSNGVTGSPTSSPQLTDMQLMAPLSDSVQHIFGSMLGELPNLRDRVAPVISLGPNATSGGGGGSRPATGGGVVTGQSSSPSERPTSTPGGENTTAPGTAPSTAQSSKKPLSQQTTRSAAAAKQQQLDEDLLPLETPRHAASAFQAIVSSGDGLPNGLSPPPQGDPWLASAERVLADETAFIEASQPALDWARKRTQFFYERDAKSYWIEDVLGDWVADEAPPPVPYAIDAVALAQEHTRRLETKYGYKVPRGLHEVGKVEPREYSKPETLRKLEAHDPGGNTATPEFVCSATLAKNDERKAATMTMTSTARQPAPPPGDSSGGSAGAVGAANVSGAGGQQQNPRAASLKQRSAAAAAAAKHDDDEDLEGRGGGAVAADGTKSQRATTTMLKASLQRPQLECDFTSVELRAAPQGEASAVLTLWNVSAYSIRIKVAPSPWVECLEVAPVNPETYHPEVPTIAGESLRVRVTFRPYEAKSNPMRVETLSFGFTRDLNQIRVNELTPLTQQWSFLEIPVTCLTILPRPHLLPVDTCAAETSSGDFKKGTTTTISNVPESALLLTEFSPIFAQTTSVRSRTLVNRGSRGYFTIHTNNEAAFTVTPRSCYLDAGESQDIVIVFHPVDDGDFNGSLEICAQETETSDEVIAAIHGSLRGVGVIPVLSFESAGSVGPASLKCGTVDYLHLDSDCVVVPPLVLLDDAAAHHASTLAVTLRNDCALPLPFLWETFSVGGAASLKVVPPAGVAPAHSNVVCTVVLTPETDETVSGLLNLYIPSMPTNEESKCWLSRQRRVPQLQPPSSSSNLTDPFGLFAPTGTNLGGNSSDNTNNSTTTANGTTVSGGSSSLLQASLVSDAAQVSPHLFAGSLRVAAAPRPVRVTLQPERIESAIDCLTQHENKRTFTLANHGPREVHFWLDPSQDANHPAAQLSPEVLAAKQKHERRMREVFGASWMPPSVQVREGCALTFTPQSGILPGNSTIEVQVAFVLHTLGHHHIDVECYCAELGREASPHLLVVADAVGPSVHVSHQLLDFGVIAVGDEAEARFVVSNHNPVQVEFRCQDPIPCEPPRFVFLPSGGMLLPGQTMDITVYRQGVPEAETQTFLEVVVKEGGTCAVECRASIQQPAAAVQPSRLDLGEVDCAISRDADVYLTNLSAIDIPYELKVLSLPPSMQLHVPKGGVLFASQANAPLRLRAQFSGAAPDTAVVTIVSQKLLEPLLFEVTCSAVKQMCVALSTSSLRGDEPAAPQGSLSLETYLEEVLWNVVTSRVLKDAHPLYSHCSPVSIPFAVIPDDDPFCAIQTRLRVDNKSGCVSRCVVVGKHFVPLLSPFRAPASSKTTQAARVATPSNAMGTDKLDQSTTTALSTSLTRKSGGGRHSQHLHHAAGGRSSSVGSSTVANQRIMKLKPDMPSFECKAIDGREGVERAQDQLREYAQSFLGDGRGVALQLTNASGPLKPYGHHDVVATLLSNLPGVYRETLRIDCEGVSPVELEMSLTVRGRPVLVDPTTSGLATAPDGSQRLTLPSVVAGMSRVKRKMRVSNRCPRDVEVTVQLRGIDASFVAVLDPETRVVTLVETGSSSSTAAAADSLVSKKTAQNTGDVATVTPNAFVLPSQQSCELTVEFAPPAHMSGEWQAQLAIVTRIARTEFNDVFLLDEFYLANKDRYPADRAITAPSLLAGLSNAVKDPVRWIPKLAVQLPLLDRPGVLKDNRLIAATPAEQLILDVYRKQLRATPSFRRKSSVTPTNAAAQQQLQQNMQEQQGGYMLPSSVAGTAASTPGLFPRGRAATPSAAPPPSEAENGDEVDSDDEEDDSGNDVRAIGQSAAKSKEELLAIDDERNELRLYLARRREELYHGLAPYLTPTMVTVVGTVMSAKLQCDPPEVLRFPFARTGEGATRSIRLTNPTRTPLDFRLSIEGPFKIVQLSFIPADGDDDVLEEDDAEGVTARRQAAAASLARSTNGADGALSSSSLSTAAKKKFTAATSLLSMSSIGGTVRTDPTSDPMQTLFHLRPRDAVDCLVELNPMSTTQLRYKHSIEGAIQVEFQGCTIRQRIPCLATVHTPSVVCDPQSTWFRPPVLLCDGRPQPKYPRTIALINTSSCDAHFRIVNVPIIDAPGGSSRGGAGAAGGETIVRLKKVQAVVRASPLEAHAQLVDDPTRFVIRPMSGVVPAATVGGAPGRVVLQLDFEEFSFMRYECKYRVEVEGGVGSDFTVRGDSREVEI